jgi:hypothetical protein
MSGPRLRNATAGDVDALVALWRACGLAFRRQAVGDELAGLLGELEARLRAKGCRKVNLLVEPANRAVVGVYRQLGYDVDDLIFMEKFL